MKFIGQILFFIIGVLIFSILIASLFATSLETPLKIFIISVIFYFFLIHYSTSELLRAIVKESFKANFFSNLNFITNHIRNESDSNIKKNAMDRYDEDKKYEKNNEKFQEEMSALPKGTEFLFWCILIIIVVFTSNYMGIIFFNNSYLSDLMNFLKI